MVLLRLIKPGPVMAILLICMFASSALAEWVVNDKGECVRVWTPEAILQGPTAIINGPFLPIRSATAAVIVPIDVGCKDFGDCLEMTGATTLFIITWPIMGTIEGMTWVVTGIADTLTGGYFDISPEDATKFSLAPLPQVPDARRHEREWRHEDRCGRTILPDSTDGKKEDAQPAAAAGGCAAAEP
jgi:hypothetical protein